MQSAFDILAPYESSLNLVDTDEIAKLNAIVLEKTAAFLQKSKEGDKIPPEITAVAVDKRHVYKSRWTVIPWIVGIGATSVLAYLAATGHAFTVLLSIVFSFFYYDLFSGTLHIVLDNPNFISMIFLGDSCLEFQWHHHIPTDITSKAFSEVCGDLNAVMCYVMIIFFAPHCGFEFRNPTAFAFAASKCLMSYFGQYCHRMSHTPITKRPQWVQWAQNNGIMISALEHGHHHKTYDANFCIGSGLWNPFLKVILDKNIFNEYVWLVLFLSMLVFDVPIINYLLTTHAGFA